MTRLLLAALVLALGACRTTLPPKPEPVSLGCADICYTPCDTEVPEWTPPNAADPEAWDYIRPQVVDPMKVNADSCEIARSECVACIDAAVKRGVIKR